MCDESVTTPERVTMPESVTMSFHWRISVMVREERKRHR
jgi:hypothetical protein